MKTLVPAFECSVGDWKYYITRMKYAEVAAQIKFAHELSRNQDISALIQRGLTARTKEITRYLLESPHRFLGALVIAVWHGKPKYKVYRLDDMDGMLEGLDKGFGILEFDGSQSYFALDGQHRLRAIKDAVAQNPALGNEDICVLLVPHENSPKGRIRTRRLFSNINRNAVKTAKAEDIVLDEDDGIAILSRQFVEEHAFFKAAGLVKIVTSADGDGGLKLAGNSISPGDKQAMLTLPILYDMLRYLAWDLPREVKDQRARPREEVLERAYRVLSQRIDDLLLHAGKIRSRLESTSDAREVRGRKGAEGKGHPFMRPVIQKAVARVVAEIIQQGRLNWGEVMRRLAKLDWELTKEPWICVATDSGKMLAAKDNVELLCQMLHAHLAPASAQSVKETLKRFKEIRGTRYRIDAEDLCKAIVKRGPSSPVEIEQVVELSEQVEVERQTEAEADE